MAWSFTDWQCGIGVIKDCVGVSPNWGNKKAFQNLVNDVVPMAQVLIIYGAAQISSSISENQMRAVNAIRCMLNSFGTNTWSLLAAGYQIGVYIGMKSDLEGYLDMGYEYVCTCLVDAQGLQESMGQSPDSIEAFSTCSEGGSNEKVAAEQARLAKEKAKIAAALKATLLAARNKTIKETVAAMKVIKDSKCDALSNAANSETCFAAIQRYSREYGLVYTSKNYAWIMSGGATSTKNRSQTDARTKAVNVRDGILAGGIFFKTAYGSFKTRFTDKGAFEPQCFTQGKAAVGSTAAVASTTVYGKTAVDACMKKFMTDQTVGGLAPILQKDARLSTAKHNCKTGNLASGVSIKGVVETKVGVVSTPPKCGVKYLANGYVQYVDNLTISCTGSGALVNGVAPILKGAENCFHDPTSAVGSRWLSRTEYLTRDMDEFRTVGAKAATDVDGTKVRCFNANQTFTETGADNCWAYKIDSQKLWGDEQYLWLAQPSCGVDTANKKIEGIAKCKQTNVPNTKAVCDKYVKWFNGQICVPKFTWVKK